jgi:hypothetical protein
MPVATRQSTQKDAGRTKTRKRNRADLLALHQRVVCDDSVLQNNKQISLLRRLRRHRIELEAQVEAEQRLSLGEQILMMTSTKPVGTAASSRVNGNRNNENGTSALLLSTHLQQQQLAATMLSLRQSRLMDAAYRLSGLSIKFITTSHPETLALRFDTSNATYHCFFEIVLDDDDGSTATNEKGKQKMYFRLVQNTLPMQVPCIRIAREAFGDTVVATDDPDLLRKLRKFSMKIYHCCWSWQARQDTFEYLQSLKSGDLSETASGDMIPPLFWVDALEKRRTQEKSNGSTTNTNTFQFTLHHRWCGLGAVCIVLEYSDELSRPRASQPVQAYIFDPSDGAMINEDFAEDSARILKRLPIREAIPKVADIIAEV